MTTKQKHREWSKDHYNNNKSVYSDQAKERRRQANEFLHNIKKQSGCVKCGESDFACLEFHHVGSIGNADKRIFQFITRGIEKLKEELKQCVVLCASCHRKLHAGRFKVGLGEVYIRPTHQKEEYICLYE